jgi:hypothetical protein
MRQRTRQRFKTLVKFNYATEGHFSQIVWTTREQRAAITNLLAKAEADDQILPDWYVGPPQDKPMPFRTFLPLLVAALWDE